MEVQFFERDRLIEKNYMNMYTTKNYVEKELKKLADDFNETIKQF